MKRYGKRKTKYPLHPGEFDDKPKLHMYTLPKGSLDDLQKIIYKLDTPDRYVSIDPGTRNFCIRIEDRFSSLSGEATKKQIFCANWDLGDENVKYLTLTENMNSISHFILNADVIIFEKQMNENIKAIRIFHHCISWFFSYYINKEYIPIMLEFPPKLKLKLLDCPQGLNKYGYKKWIVEWARGEAQIRRDNDLIKRMSSKKKLDDEADTLGQIEAYCMYKCL